MLEDFAGLYSVHAWECRLHPLDLLLARPLRFPFHSDLCEKVVGSLRPSLRPADNIWMAARPGEKSRVALWKDIRFGSRDQC